MNKYSWTENGRSYRIAGRFVLIGPAKWSNKTVFDSTTPAGVRTYDEAGLARALAAQFDQLLAKTVRAVDRFEKRQLRGSYAA